MSMLKVVIDYARTAMPAEFGDIEVQSRATEARAIAEIMRRINYNPDPRHLVESRARWNGVFTKPITDVKQAKKAYLDFAAHMNGDMAGALMAALKRRAAGFPPVDWSNALKTAYDPDIYETIIVETEEFKAEQERLKSVGVADQTIEGVVDRLLETAPLDDARWGGW